jgi:hypothetical protein
LFAFLSRNWGFLALVNRSAGGNDSVCSSVGCLFCFLAPEDFDIHTEKHTFGDFFCLCPSFEPTRKFGVCVCVQALCFFAVTKMWLAATA